MYQDPVGGDRCIVNFQRSHQHLAAEHLPRVPRCINDQSLQHERKILCDSVCFRLPTHRRYGVPFGFTRLSESFAN